MKIRNRYLVLLMLPVWYLVYHYLAVMADFFVEALLGMERGTHLSETLWFFVYEVPKVLMLLVLIIFVVGIVRSYFSAEKTRQLLAGKSLFAGNVMAALLGIVTPFCSCSAIPLFLGFVEAGIPLGVTLSFLIAAPMINEVAIVLLLGMFGWKITVIYVATGLSIAILSGWIIGRLGLERYVMDWVYEVKVGEQDNGNTKISFDERIKAGWGTVKEIVGKIWIYVVIGIAVGAGAHGYVPENYLAELMGKGHWYAVPLAIAVGVPLYSNAAGIIPIISVLISKGVSLGTALAFMMSVIGLSLPEMIILKKVLKLPMILIFVGIVASGIILVGFIFNIFY